MNENINTDLKEFGNVIVNAMMKDYTTFKVGGPADYLVTPNSHDNCASLISYLSESKVPYTIVGAGSNLVIGDKGIRGVVVRLCENNCSDQEIKILENDIIYSDAGVSKSDFIDFAISNGYGDIEFMVGIPGCIGGGIFMNAGTFMGTFVNILKRIKYIDYNGNIIEKDINPEMAHYRKMELDDAVIILGGFFELKKSENIEITKKNVNDIINDRKQKHPWSYPSAGSVFKNPEGHQSWKLVDDCGLKGYKIGGAMVSTLHTNFIINENNATAKDVRSLIEHVQKTVKCKFNVDLHTEIKMIGEF